MKRLRPLLQTLLAPVLLGWLVWGYSGPAGDLDLRTRPRTMTESGATSAPRTPEALQRILVKFKDDSLARTADKPSGATTRTSQRITRAAQEASAGRAGTLSHLRAASGGNHVYQTGQALTRLQMQAVVQALAQDPDVESVVVDERVYPHAFAATDPDYTSGSNPQWYLKAPGTDLGAADFAGAWNRSTSAAAPVSGQGVYVATLDTGYRLHADFVNSDTTNNIAGGYDFISADATGVYLTANDGDSRDASALDPGDGNTNPSYCTTSASSWHGTRVAGLIAAATNNGAGMAGAAYRAKVIPARVLGVCGGYLSDVVDAIRWSAGITVNGSTNPTPAQVLNLSLGSINSCNVAYQAAINDVRTLKKATVVVSTGNDGSNTTITAPANCQGVIAVTGHRADGTSPSFANLGAGTTLSAPGVSIYSTSNTGTQAPSADTYASANGTSFSAPLVAAAAALMYQVKPGITPDEVASRLVNSARSFPVGTYCNANYACGAGMLDADAAVVLVQNDDTPVATATASATQGVARNTAVTLTGTATPGASGTAVATMQWTQVAGPAVSIANASSNSASIVTPASSTETLLVFRFRAITASPNIKTADSYVGVSMVSTASASTGVNASGGGGGGALDHVALIALAMLALVMHRLAQRPRTTP